MSPPAAAEGARELAAAPIRALNMVSTRASHAALMLGLVSTSFLCSIT